MGQLLEFQYVIHPLYNKKEDLNDDLPVITEKEWMSIVEQDPELTQDPDDSMNMSGDSVTLIGYLDKNDGNKYALYLYNGYIQCDGPSDNTINKMT